MKEISKIEEKTLKIFREAIIIDLLLTTGKFPKDPGYFYEMRKKGVTAVHVSIIFSDTINIYNVMERIISWYQAFEKYSDVIMPVTTTKDIEVAKKQNKVGIILGFQNIKPIENNIDFLDIFYRLGIRVIQLTYQRQNWVGGGCDERTDSGLSKCGIEVIKRMNKLGILVDLSHCGNKTTMEAIEVSEKPVAFTHASARALFDLPRNKTDEEIKALSEKNGVMGLIISPFSKNSIVTLDDFLNLIDYIVNLVGIKHVGLGLDFAPFDTKDEFDSWKKNNPGVGENINFETRYSPEIKSVNFLLELTKELLKRGYSEVEIKKILGENNLNLFKKILGE